MKRISYSRFLARAAMTLLAAFFSFTGARAQETLTVYEGTTTNYYVPAYILYFDDFTRSQFVIPADDLADMEGGTITSIKFYTTSGNVPYTTVSSADVYLKEVDYTTMTGLEPKTDDDIVYQGYFDVVTEGEGGSLTITFDTPYTYHGGNLLIGIENTEDVDYNNIYFYGTTVEGASWGGSNDSSLESVTGSQRNFIPKTTFEYTPGSGVFVPKPTTFTVSDITDCSAELAWTGGTGTYNLEIQEAGGDFEELLSNTTETSYTLDNLAAYTDYSVRIQSVDGENVSGWKTVSFTTEMCPLEDQCTITLALTDSYGDGWNGAYIEIVDVETGASLGTFTNQNVAKKAVETKEKEATFAEAKAADTKAEGTKGEAETETYTFAVCKDREIQFVWHSGSYDSECSFVIYDVNDNVIVSGTASVLPYNHTVDCTTTDYRKPTDLAAEVATRSAVLSWTENSLCTVNDWVIAYKANSEEEFTEVTVSQNPYTLEGLVPETRYTFKVRPVATDGAIQWSDEYSFTTLVAAPVPTALAVSDITTTSAHVSWTGIGESYDLRYVTNPNYVFQGYVTNPGAMDGGADASWKQGSQSTYGPNVNYANDYMLADDFTVYTATTLHEIEVYGYQTGSTTTSTFTGLHVQIYDGNPAEGGELIWGDMDTNIMTATSFTNCYRGSNGETSAMTRPIMAITASGLDIELEPGTYWLVYSLEGTGSSGPWGVPYAEPTVGNTGEGLQHTSSGWIALTDDGSQTPLGCAMKLTFEDLESLDWSYVNNIEGGEYDLTSLNPETTYLVQVRANYSDEGLSKWISTTFTTKSGKEDPTDLAATEISATKATLNWTGYQDSYNVRYRIKEAYKPTNVIFSDDFENGLDNWTQIDADGDGYNWLYSSNLQAHNGEGLVISQSYINNVGVLTPDNYLVSPQVELGGIVSFYACAQDASCPDDHFGVAVSTTGNTDAADFTTVAEWTMTAEGTPASESKVQGAWGFYTVDLSTYAGQTGYIALRHFNCTDKYFINVDDFTYSGGLDYIPTGEWTEITATESSVEISGLAQETEYEWQVQGIFDGGTTNWVSSSFTTLPAPHLVDEPYVVYEDGTLTFYFDKNKEGMNGMDIDNSGYTPNWFNYHSMIEEVVFHELFANCTSITSTANWFSNCSSLETIIGIENLKTNNVTNMSGMFYGCSGLTSLDLNNFDTGNVTNMSYMFSDCSSLTTIYIGESWATDKVQESNDMFMGCENIVGVDGTVYNPSFTDKTKAYSGEGGYLTFKIDAEDFLALQRFYNAFDGDNWTASKWNLVYRYFPGVSIKNGQVTAIHLENNGLNGSCTGNTLLEFPKLTTLNLANNELGGNVSALAGAFPMLKSLNVSGNHFSEVVPVLPLTITTLDMTCQSIEQDIEADLLDFTPEQVPSLLLYNHAGQSYYMAQSLKLANYPPTATTYQPEKPFWGFMATGFNGNIPQFNFLTSDNTYHGQSGDALYYSYPNASPMVANSYCQFKYNFRQGDANMYGGVNVLDLQTIINYMFEEYALLPFNYTAANLWADDVINVQDAVVLVNMLLDMNNSNNAGARKRGAWSGHEEYTQASIYCHDGTLYLNTSKPVAAFDITVDGCSAIQFTDEMKKNGIICSVKSTGSSVHLVGYSLNQGHLPIGITAIGKLTTDGSLTIRNAVLSDQDAMEIAVSKNGNTFTAIRTSMDSETDKEERYRLIVGRNRSIIIDTTGKKTITKDEK